MAFNINGALAEMRQISEESARKFQPGDKVTVSELGKRLTCKVVENSRWPSPSEIRPNQYVLVEWVNGAERKHGEQNQPFPFLRAENELTAGWPSQESVQVDETAESFIGSFLTEMDNASNDNNPNDPLLQIQGFGGLKRSQIISRMVDDLQRMEKKLEELEAIQNDSAVVDQSQVTEVATSLGHSLDLFVAYNNAIKDNTLHYTQEPGYQSEVD